MPVKKCREGSEHSTLGDSSMHVGELFMRDLLCPPRWAEAVVVVAGHEVYVRVEDLLLRSSPE
jgi:hypothetical protein